MKKLVLFFPMYIFYACTNTQWIEPEKTIFETFPTLEQQIANLKSGSVENPFHKESIEHLATYADSKNPEIKKRLRLLLQEEMFVRLLKDQSFSPEVDGSSNEWWKIYNKSSDQEGDGLANRDDLDITGFGATIDNNLNLHIFVKTKGPANLHWPNL